MPNVTGLSRGWNQRIVDPSQFANAANAALTYGHVLSNASTTFLSKSSLDNLHGFLFSPLIDTSQELILPSDLAIGDELSLVNINTGVAEFVSDDSAVTIYNIEGASHANKGGQITGRGAIVLKVISATEWRCILAIDPEGIQYVTEGVEAGQGQDGASAHEIAVGNGFVGDETAWLASLQGEDGENGLDGTSVVVISLTQAAYDALDPPVSDTFYAIPVV